MKISVTCWPERVNLCSTVICRLHRGGRIEQQALTLTIVLHFKVLKRYCCNNFQGLALRALIMFYGKIKSAYGQNIEGHNLERHKTRTRYII